MSYQDEYRIRKPNIMDKALYNRLLKISGWDCKLGKEIGEGRTSTVFCLKGNPIGSDSRQHGRIPEEAVKIVDLRLISSDLRESVRTRCIEELEMMKKLRNCQHAAKLLNCAILHAADMSSYLSGSEFHPNDPVIIFLIMPRYDVIPLNTTLEHGEVIQLGIHICDVLQRLCDNGVLHRDVKPSNIFIHVDDTGKHYLLGDFGICRSINGEHLTGWGTPLYYPPEWSSGIKSRNGDLYSLAVAMAKLLGGRHGDNLDNNQEIVGRLNWQEFKRRNLAFPALQDILKKGLQDYQRRYREPRDMQADLQLLVDYKAQTGCFPMDITLEEVRDCLQGKPTGPAWGPNLFRKKPAADPGDYAQASRDALLARDFRRAASLSSLGHGEGDMHCTALLAYASLHLIRQGQLPSNYRKNIEKLLQDGYPKLEDDAIEQTDPSLRRQLTAHAAAMKCLLAVSRFEAGNHTDFLRLIRSAAKGGSPMACYICGRGMYTGDQPFQKDEHQGWNYLLDAARSGYRAALAYVIEERRNNPYVRVPTDIRTAAKASGLSVSGHLLEDILREL